MTNDPRKAKGSIAAVGGPHDRDGAIIDATNAVLLDGMVVAFVETPGLPRNAPPETVAMSLMGRINQTRDRSEVVYLFSPEAAASICADLIGLMNRAGRGQEMERLLMEQIARLP